MNRKNPSQSKRKGSAIALVLMAVVVLSAMGAGLLTLGLRGRSLAIRTASEISARSAADTGLAKAVFEMNGKLEVEPWNDSTLPQATDEDLENTDATFSYTVTVDSNSVYNIESIGKSGRAERIVNCDLKLEGLFESAIFTQGDILLRNGTVVDWYNYDADDESMKVGTNSTEPGSIDMKTGAIINGDVLVGTGGDPDVIIDDDGATITGDTYAAIEEYEFESVTVPEELQLLPSSGTLRDSIIIISNAKYDKIDLKNSRTISVEAAVSLYVIGDVILKNSAQLQVADNGNASLILYLGGKLLTMNGGTINNMTQDPTKLKIYALDSCSSIDFITNSAFYGAIYAPNADVRLHNSVEFFGSVIANSFIQDVFADFHYDASLRDVSVTDEGVSFAVKHWSEQ